MLHLYGEAAEYEKDLSRMRKFLEFAKASVKKGVRSMKEWILVRL
jgi:hypothetical protein